MTRRVIDRIETIGWLKAIDITYWTCDVFVEKVIDILIIQVSSDMVIKFNTRLGLDKQIIVNMQTNMNYYRNDKRDLSWNGGTKTLRWPKYIPGSRSQALQRCPCSLLWYRLWQPQPPVALILASACHRSSARHLVVGSIHGNCYVQSRTHALNPSLVLGNFRGEFLSMPPHQFWSVPLLPCHYWDITISMDVLLQTRDKMMLLLNMMNN